MAKKVVATIQSRESKSFAKVIFSIKSPKTGSYVFKEKVVQLDEVSKYIGNMRKID